MYKLEVLCVNIRFALLSEHCSEMNLKFADECVVLFACTMR